MSCLLKIVLCKQVTYRKKSGRKTNELTDVERVFAHFHCVTQVRVHLKQKKITCVIKTLNQAKICRIISLYLIACSLFACSSVFMSVSYAITDANAYTWWRMK